MKYKAIIFDLDGTLTDTLEDLFLSTNYALRSCGLPERTLEEVRRFVGNGVRCLIERAVPEDTKSRIIEQCFGTFRAHYLIHCQDNTHLYPGIAALLMSLHAKGYRMAVVSNKLQRGVDDLARTFFNGMIDVAIGEQFIVNCMKYGREESIPRRLSCSPHFILRKRSIARNA